jgi:DHA1 family bicyclomycin/chloramphenicol resistance-like MFS transporter
LLPEFNEAINRDMGPIYDKNYIYLARPTKSSQAENINKLKTQRYFRLVVILGLLTALCPFFIDMYLPGFQDIADNLHTSVARVSLSLSTYFIGISAGQLLYGPLLDRYGRKKTSTPG